MANAVLARGESQVVLTDAMGDTGLQWIEVMPTAAKARNGRFFFTVTADDLEVYAQSIRDNPGKIPVDYDHSGAPDLGGSTRAAGWFTGQADVRDTGQGPRLMAEVQWTPRAQQEIRDGEFRMVSAEFSFQQRDKKTGLLTKAKDIVAATLTNRPFFKDLAPVTASELLDTDVIDGLADLLDVGTLALVMAALVGDLDTVRAAVWSTAQVNDLPDASFLYVEPGGSKDAGGKTTPRTLRHFPYRDAGGNVDMPHLRNALARIPQSNLPADVKATLTSKAESILNNNHGGQAAAEEHAMSDLKVIATALGLAETATDEEIEAAVKASADRQAQLEQQIEELKANAGDADAATARIVALETSLAEERKLRVTAARDRMLEDAISEGRIVPAAKDALAEQFSENVDGLKAVLASMPANSFTPIGSGSGSAEDVEVTDRQRDRFASAAADGISEDGLTVHAKAEKLLKEQGKTVYTQDEYLAALDAVA